MAYTIIPFREILIAVDSIEIGEVPRDILNRFSYNRLIPSKVSQMEGGFLFT